VLGGNGEAALRDHSADEPLGVGTKRSWIRRALTELASS
jgi:hypothetical protein